MPDPARDVRPPHCDPLVLHPPGECRFCDAHPDWQTYRQTAGIAFTGQPPSADQVGCPAEARRPLELIYRWPGNRALPPGFPTDVFAYAPPDAPVLEPISDLRGVGR
jgi:hypothetical protein